MFYWNRQTQESTTLKQELLSAVGARKIRIATAFLSNEGVSILEEMRQTYDISKNDIDLFLSAEFSPDKPHELLKRLSDICSVKIIFERNFHPKVYLICGKENKLIYGSSNFTLGGLQNNVEFDFIGVPSEKDLKAANDFFDFCDKQATPVNNDVIEYYAENAAEIEELKSTQKKLRSKLQGYHKKGDDFLESDYDISDHYFTFEDYETFFTRNHRRTDIDIRNRRQRVQDKMLKIHSRIYPQIKKMGIACHKREDNITSSIIPSVFNHHIVAWNGVRYGKTPKEIDAFNFGGGKEDIYGFQKHGCLQYCIVGSGFEINLFLAVRHDAWDRAYMHEKIKTLKPSIERELKELYGYGLKWVIYDNGSKHEYVFDIDSEEPENFCEYFLKYDCDGRESLLLTHYMPDDELLKDIDIICEEVIAMIKLLLPLYNVMVNRPKGFI